MRLSVPAKQATTRLPGSAPSVPTCTPISNSPSTSGKLGSAFQSPLVTTVQQPMQARAQAFQQQASQSVQQAMSLWKQAIAISPTDSAYQRALYRDALAIQDYGTAYQAVKKVLALEPAAPDKKQLVTLAKQLKPLANLKTSSTTGSPTP